VVTLTSRNKKWSAEKLQADPDFVICTPEYLVRQFRAIENVKQWDRIARLSLPKVAGPMPSRVEKSPIFSDHFRLSGFPWDHVLVDEAHVAKNVVSGIHEALKALDYRRILLISGTFVKNTWVDVWCILRLMPRQPFQSTETFFRVFGTLDE